MTSPRDSPAPDPERVAELFGEVSELPAEERAARLQAAGAADPELRREVESLLLARDQASGFLEGLDLAQAAALLAAGEQDFASGVRVGPYRVLRELGRGGMSRVYLAERADGAFDQQVALKVLRRDFDSAPLVERFLQERQILARLEHPNIARLLDGGLTADGRPFLAMEHVRGTQVNAWCDARGLPIEQRLALFEQICRAVAYAHANLIVHRDLRPSNILVTDDGEVKLLDFGIAKLLAEGDGAEAAKLTRPGPQPFTPGYAAPEQLRGGPMTTATDVYALGVVLYELLTGRRPPPGRAAVGPERPSSAVARPANAGDADDSALSPAAIAAARASRPDRLRRRLAGDLDTIVLQALRAEPERRYPTVAALAEDLRRHQRRLPVSARPDSLAYRVAKFAHRHRVGVLAAGLALTALVVGLLAALWQSGVAARERDLARREAAKAEAVRDFLVNLFQGADPATAKGEEITAREVLDSGVGRIDLELAGQPAVAADLLATVAEIYGSLGRHDRAPTLAERALARLREVHGPEHPEVARALGALGEIRSAAAQYEQAEKDMRQALAMQRRLLPPDHAEVAEGLTRLAGLLVTRAQLDEAESLLREAVASQRRALSADDPRTAETLGALGGLLLSQGKPQDAAREYRAALAIRQLRLGDLHPEVAVLWSSLGAALLADGDVAGAEAAHRQALATRRKLFGEEHSAVTLSLQHLAGTLHSKGDLRAAEPLYRQAVELERRLRGVDHPLFAVAERNLGHVLADLGRLAEARGLLEDALARARRAMGDDHPRVASTRDLLG